MENILTIENLDITFRTNAGKIHAIRGVDLALPRGKTVALVGESGSGKSVTMKAVAGLLDSNSIINSGKIIYNGVDLLTMTKKDLRRKINGQQIAMVFQDPMTSLDPTMTIGAQITEGMLLHTDISKSDADKKALELMNLVGIVDAERRMKNYPHQLSGGMRQRVVIAIALSCEPKILICDEPTTALDVTIQARILDLISDIQKKMGLSVIYITHDLGVVAKVALSRAAPSTKFSTTRATRTRGDFYQRCRIWKPTTTGCIQSQAARRISCTNRRATHSPRATSSL